MLSLITPLLDFFTDANVAKPPLGGIAQSSD
jgi:hypothetical protein